MEEPLFAQTEGDLKKEEPWDDFPQEVKEEVAGDDEVLDQSPFFSDVKPTIDSIGTTGTPLPEEPHRERTSALLTFNSQILSNQPAFRLDRYVPGFGLPRHLIEHSIRRPYGCRHCPLEFRTYEELKEHLFNTHLHNKGEKEAAKEKPNTLTVYEYDSRSRALVQKPPNVRKTSTPVCSGCGKTFVHLSDFIKHKSRFNGTAHFYCQPCDMTGAASGLEVHRKSGIHLLGLKRTADCKAKKRPFPEETEGAVKRLVMLSGKNAPSKMRIPQWEKAAGAQNAEDLLGQVDHLDETAVKIEETAFEDDLSEWKAMQTQIDHLDETTVKIEEAAFEDDLSEWKAMKTQEKSLQPVTGDLPFAYECRFCTKGFHVFQALWRHMNEFHPGKPPLWCYLCSKYYKHENLFWNHLTKKHGVSRPEDHPAGYTCDECEAHFRLRFEYAQHCQFLRGNPHTLCKRCDQTVFNEDLPKHLSFCNYATKTSKFRYGKYKNTPSMRRLSASKFLCLECGKLCLGSGGYKLHRESLKKTPHAFCEPCGLVLDSDAWEDHRHATGNHEDVKMHFYCCSMTFPPEKWESHQLEKCHLGSTWTDKTPPVWKCPVMKCGFAFFKANVLDKHMIAVHPGEPPFPCRQCPQPFWDRSARYHHEEKEHPQNV